MRSMQRRCGITLVSATVLLGMSSSAHAQPTVDQDFGALSNGVTYTHSALVAAYEPAHWVRFTIPAVPAGDGPGQVYLDVRTTNPGSNTTFISSMVGLYDSAGNLATGSSTSSVDGSEGPGLVAGSRGGALSFGATCPTRPNAATSPATTAGTLFNGRDGALVPGTYYVAVVRSSATFGASAWSVTPPTTGTVIGTVQLEITLGTTGNPAPLTTASAATPSAGASGFTSLLTVTRGTCTPTDVPTSVSIDLSSVGGSAAASMYDDATHGDVTGADGVWSLSTPITAPAGTYALTATATNAYSLTSTRSVSVSVDGAPNAAIKISQLNATAAAPQSWACPRANFVEIHNTSGSVVDLSGWAVQVASGSGTTWTVNPFPTGFTIPANGYALVGLGAQGTPNNDPNATNDVFGYNYAADVTGSAGSLIPSSGKIALTSSHLALTGACPTSSPSVMDFVGYGGANCSEVAPAPAMSQTDGRSLYRACAGGTDSGVNSADFVLDYSAPRNRTAPGNLGAMTALGAPAPALAPSVQQNSDVLLTATAASCSGTPSGVAFTANLSFVGGPASQPMFDDGTNGDAAANDGIFSYAYTIPDTLLPAPPPGPTINRPYIVPMTGTDSLGRVAPAFAAFYVTAAPTGGCCINGGVSVRTQASCLAAGGTYLGDGAAPYPTAGTVYPGTAFTWINIRTVSQPGNVVTAGVTTDSIVISDTSTVDSLVVHISPYYPYLGELACTLTKGATTVSLFDHVGVRTGNATGRPGDFQSSRDYRFMENGTGFWNAAFNGGKDSAYIEPEGWYAPSAALNAPASLAPFLGSPAAGTWTLTFYNISADSSGYFSWSLEINPANPCPTPCPADLDDGSSTGTPDGGVDINDLLYFLTQYEAGALPADLADGSCTGTPDGGVDINDLLFFLAHYEAGC